jgi:hypothetical protein
MSFYMSGAYWNTVLTFISIPIKDKLFPKIAYNYQNTQNNLRVILF